MTELLELQAEDATSQPPRDERILGVFDAKGRAITIRGLAQACIDEGIWTREELDRIAFRSVQESCRRVLRTKDANGLPRNGQTMEIDEDGQHVWKDRQLWLFPDYELNIHQHLEQRDENHSVAIKLAAEAVDRFGRAIDVPSLIGS